MNVLFQPSHVISRYSIYDGINSIWEPGGGGNVTKCENAFHAFLRALEAPNCLGVKESI